MPDRRPFQRTCPFCGIALIGSAQDREGENDIYHCPRCQLVIDVSVPGKTETRHRA